MFKRQGSRSSNNSTDSKFTISDVSPLGKLEKHHLYGNNKTSNRHSQSRLSLASTDSVATTGRLLDQLGLPDEDWESIYEAEDIPATNEGLEKDNDNRKVPLNYVPASRFRSLRPMLMSQKAHEQKNSAVDTVLSYVSTVHLVKSPAPQLVHNDDSRTSIHLDELSSSATSEKYDVFDHDNPLDEFSPSHCSSSITVNEEFDDDDDDGKRSFTFGDDTPTKKTFEPSTPTINHHSTFDYAEPDSPHIHVNSAYMVNMDQSTLRASQHTHSLSNPSDMLTLSRQSHTKSPRSPFTKTFHQGFYHATAPFPAAPVEPPSPSRQGYKLDHPSLSQTSISTTGTMPRPHTPPSQPVLRDLDFLSSEKMHQRQLSSQLEEVHLDTKKERSKINIKGNLLRTPSAPSLMKINRPSQAPPAPPVDLKLPMYGNEATFERRRLDDIQPRSFTAPSTVPDWSAGITKPLQAGNSHSATDLSNHMKRNGPPQSHSLSSTVNHNLPQLRAAKHAATYPQTTSPSNQPPQLIFAKDKPLPNPQQKTQQKQKLPQGVQTSNVITSSETRQQQQQQQQQQQPLSVLTPEARVSMAIALRKSGQSKDAAYQLSIAGNQGNIEGMLLYGLSLRYGYGVRKDDRLSFLWICKAGKIDIQKPGGYHFDIDPKKLIDSSSGKSMKAKEPECSIFFEIGQAYTHGWGCERDPDQGLEFFELSGSLGYTDAMCEAGTMWCSSNGKKRNGQSQPRKKNLSRAAAWFRLAVQSGVELVGSSWIYKDKYL
ncbi:hypothetical protein CANARDRAFT_174942 [[Candida] arabinofermentans NRRL YB-2248]|uniref:Uncharacterized protein n=1 Tax=[Candida] arabinofermentans NRRL YB-2248 TaxID=983967 RepID=A0A1E4T569_9ASCO|nr:hypothetical protein CANARDRAFT_174942 [[Candida] arabinofermentans NRRL YB-2248]